MIGVAVLAAATVPDSSYRTQWGTPKAVTAELAVLFGLGALALALGAVIAAVAAPPRPVAAVWPDLDDGRFALLRRASTVLTALTVTGYVAFAGLALARGVTPAVVLDAVTSGVYAADLRTRIGTLPGLTTMTQFGPAAAVVSGLLLARDGRDRAEWAKLGAVFVLALPRAYLMTERLAVLEILVPLVVVAACAGSTRPRTARRLSFAPAVALPGLVAVFAAFEYSRSWNFYRARTDSGFAQFALERFAGYYTTAVNNAGLRMQYMADLTGWPRATLEFLWSAPGVSALDLHRRLSGVDTAQVYADVLVAHGNPEFNNDGGIADPFLDYGTLGGLALLVAVGFVAATLYRGMRESRPAGLLFYPFLFLGLLELPRYLYWTQGRTLPAIAGLAVVAVLLHRSRPPVPAVPVPPPAVAEPTVAEIAR